MREVERQIGMPADSSGSQMLSVKGIRSLPCSIKAPSCSTVSASTFASRERREMPLVEMTHLPKFSGFSSYGSIPRTMVLFCEKFSEVYFKLSVNLL